MTPANQLTIKPCPFCGGTFTRKKYVAGTGCNTSLLECDKCNAQGPLAEKYKAIEKWNERATAAQDAQPQTSETPSAAPSRDTITELLDAAFRELQHDSGEQNEEWHHSRNILRKKFSSILRRSRTTQDESAKQEAQPAPRQHSQMNDTHANYDPAEAEKMTDGSAAKLPKMIDADALEYQIAADLEVALCDGKLGPDQYVAENRKTLRAIIDRAIAMAIKPAQSGGSDTKTPRTESESFLAEPEDDSDALKAKLCIICAELDSTRAELAAVTSERRRNNERHPQNNHGSL